MEKGFNLWRIVVVSKSILNPQASKSIVHGCKQEQCGRVTHEKGFKGSIADSIRFRATPFN
jgi:hypothetical protein